MKGGVRTPAETAELLERFDALDRALVAKGFPATSPWWRETIERFYKSGRRQCVLRVGRRGGKSSTLARIAVLEALYGKHKIQPGDVGIVGVVSVSRDEANQRLRTIKAILDALGVKYRPIEAGIELDGRPIAFKVFAASVASVVGGTWIAAIVDEVARLRDADTGANPATEILASLRPTMATMPNAKLFLSSSPLGIEDAHAKAFDAGDTDFQMVAFAPTWVANPTISEADTHVLEPDERTRLREFGAQAQGSAMGAFEPEAIERAFRLVQPGIALGRPIVSLDPSGRGSHNFAWMTLGYCAPHVRDTDRFEQREIEGPNGCFEMLTDANGNWIKKKDWAPGEPFLYVNRCNVADARYKARVTLDDILKRIAHDARAVGACRIIADQYEAYSLESWAKRYRLSFKSYPTTATNKARAVVRLRRLMNEGGVVFEHDPNLRRELLSYQERIGANGVAYGGADPTGGHHDRIACLISAMVADLEGDLFGSPGARDHQIYAMRSTPLHSN